MNLLLFLQTGLLFSANRWKVAVNKNKPLLWLCGIFYVIAPLLEKPNSMWAAPLFFYLFIILQVVRRCRLQSSIPGSDKRLNL